MNITRSRRRFAKLLGIALLAIGIPLVGCELARPNNIPKDSVLVNGADEHWWEWCFYDQKENVDYCRIFNAGGDVIWNEVFLPYDGGKAANEAELMIDSEARLKSWQFVCLKNGRILLPKSKYEDFKEFLDRRTGKSKAP